MGEDGLVALKTLIKFLRSGSIPSSPTTMERKIPTLKDLMTPEPLVCPICERPNYFPSDHHMVPKSRGGKTTETICEDCHKAIHAHFTNKELEETYHTPEILLSHEGFAKQIKFLSKQDPGGRTKTKKNKDRLARDR